MSTREENSPGGKSARSSRAKARSVKAAVSDERENLDVGLWRRQMGVHGDAARLQFVNKLVYALARKAKGYRATDLHDWPLGPTNTSPRDIEWQVRAPVFEQLNLAEIDFGQHSKLVKLLDDRTPDVVVVVSVLEHMPDETLDKFLSGLKRCLQKWSMDKGKLVPCLVVTLEPRFFLGDFFDDGLDDQTRDGIHSGTLPLTVTFSSSVVQGKSTLSHLRVTDVVCRGYVPRERFVGLLEGLLADYANDASDVRPKGVGVDVPVVLDLGCGEGNLGRFLGFHGLQYLGVDASRAMIDAARSWPEEVPAKSETAIRKTNINLRTERWYERRFTDLGLTVLDQLPMLRRYLSKEDWDQVVSLPGASKNNTSRGPFYAWLLEAVPASDADTSDENVALVQDLLSKRGWPSDFLKRATEVLRKSSSLGETAPQIIRAGMGARIVHAGTMGGALYVLLSGRLALVNRSGKPFVPFQPGELIGELELGDFPRKPNASSYFTDRFLYSVDVLSDEATVLYLPPRAVSALAGLHDKSSEEAAHSLHDFLYGVLRQRFVQRTPLLYWDSGRRGFDIWEKIRPLRPFAFDRKTELKAADGFFELVARAVTMACAEEASSGMPGAGELAIVTPSSILATLAKDRDGDGTVQGQRIAMALNQLAEFAVFDTFERADVEDSHALIETLVAQNQMARNHSSKDLTKGPEHKDAAPSNSYSIFRHDIVAHSVFGVDDLVELWNKQILWQACEVKGLIRVPNLHHLWCAGTKDKFLVGPALLQQKLKRETVNDKERTVAHRRSAQQVIGAIQKMKKIPLTTSLPSRTSDCTDVYDYLSYLTKIGILQINPTYRARPKTAHERYLLERAITIYLRLASHRASERIKI